MNTDERLTEIEERLAVLEAAWAERVAELDVILADYRQVRAVR